MPVLFSQNGYETTVCDPVYGNYRWISDTSIYDDYPEIRAFVTEGYFTNNNSKDIAIRNRYRNFFCFSLMKSMPVFLQSIIYDGGNYNKASKEVNEQPVFTTQVVAEDSSSKAMGASKEFIDGYNVLLNMNNITKITEEEKNTFLMMANNTTHEYFLLQKPDYVPVEFLDNTEYDEAFGKKITVDGKTMTTETLYQKTHYQTNMAAMLQVGKWLDYLRENDVFDNTRIIMVSDHGNPNGQFEELIIGEHDVQGYHPMLMMKDFGSTEFTVSEEFMTNADVATLATSGCIENPVNPMTGKPLNNNEKTAHEQYVIVSKQWNTQEHGENTFNASKWARVKDNLWDKNNWEFYEKETVLKDYSFPKE